MPIDLRYDPEKKILYSRVKGTVSFEEFQSTMKLITRSGQFPQNANALWDLRELDFETIDSDFWKRIINIRKQYPERGQALLAHVVQGDLAYGMLRMYEILADSDSNGLAQHIKVFKNCSDAEKWLLNKGDAGADP